MSQQAGQLFADSGQPVGPLGHVMLRVLQALADIH